jgi:Holliday junction resolvase
MAKTPEKKIKDKVTAQLKELGAYYFYPFSAGYSSSGVPDIVGCYRGRFFGIECKAKGNKPTELQKINLNKIEGVGGIALVIDESNVDRVAELIGGMK